MITLGLSQIEAGDASTIGAMPVTMIKIGKTYKDSCKLVQASSDVTEHYEEGRSAAEVRRKSKKAPTLTFSLMDPDPQLLADLIGGEITGGNTWGFDGTEFVANRAIRVKSEQGMWIDIPNGDIEAVINSEFSEKGIFLVDVTVVPAAVTARKAMFAYPQPSLVLDSAVLEFAAASDTGAVTPVPAAAVSNVYVRPGDTWLTAEIQNVNEVYITASENTGAPRSSYVTIVSGGNIGIVTVNQDEA